MIREFFSPGDGENSDVISTEEMSRMAEEARLEAMPAAETDEDGNVAKSGVLNVHDFRPATREDIPTADAREMKPETAREIAH